jgi:hypothetical protein
MKEICRSNKKYFSLIIILRYTKYQKIQQIIYLNYFTPKQMSLKVYKKKIFSNHKETKQEKAKAKKIRVG